MATGGTPFDNCRDDQDLPNWAVSNGSLEDRLNNMDWGTQQKANRPSEKNRKKCGTAVESRVTNDISPESTPGAGRRRARTPHSFPHVKYSTQMSVPDQAELERLRQRINFTDLDERSIGSDSQGRVTAANNQRQLADDKKAFNFLPLHVNTNKSKESSVPAPPAAVPLSASRGAKKQALVLDLGACDLSKAGRAERGAGDHGRGELGIDSSQVVSKLVQIREYIGKASTIRDDLVEKNDIPANVERLSHLIVHLKEQEKSYLRYLQKMLAGQKDRDEVRAVDLEAGLASVAESVSLNAEAQPEGSAAGWTRLAGTKEEEEEELENLRRQQELLKKMLMQQEQLRALRGQQEALMAMQSQAPRTGAVLDDTVVTETTGSVSGLSITAELNDELNYLIQRFHNQLHDTQTKVVPDNRRQAESLSLAREVSRVRPLPPTRPQHAPASVSSARLTKLQELQDKKETMDKILEELHTLRDHTLNNRSYGVMSGLGQRGPEQRELVPGGSVERPSALNRELNGRVGVVIRHDSASSYREPQPEDSANPPDKLRKLKEVHKRLNELRELVQYYEQSSDMMADTVNENVKDEDDDTEAMFDSEQENPEPVTKIRNPRHAGNWVDTSGATSSHRTNNQDGRLNTNCEINNRSAANLRSLNFRSTIECQYNRYHTYNEPKDGSEDEEVEEEDEREGLVDEEEVQEPGPGNEASGSSRRSSLGGGDPELVQKVRRLQTAKQKLRQLQELVAMVQSDDTDATTANEEEGPVQQPNNARAPVPKPQRDPSATEAAREKFYQAKLKQQQRELGRLQEERQRLTEIQGKIHDLQWACPDLQSSLSSTMSQQDPRKPPEVPSTPSAGANGPAPLSTEELVPENELFSEIRRHQVLREELRHRRKQLEGLMAEQQRRTQLPDSACGAPPLPTPQPLSRDERTMATWGGSTPRHLEDEDCYPSETGAEEEEEEEEEEADSSSSEDLPLYTSRTQASFSGHKSNESGPKASNPYPAGAAAGPASSGRGRQQGGAGGRRQENMHWAWARSPPEVQQHWQDQVTQLHKQLQFSTSMCQTLLHDQQSLSCLLQSLLSTPYSVIPSNVGSPQVHLVMHQLNQCYTQLAWQQNNVQRLKQLLNELLLQQQQAQPGQQSARPASPGAFVPPFPMGLPGLAGFSPVPTGLGFSPMFAPDFGQTAVPQPGAQQQMDHNSSARTEYMSFPQPPPPPPPPQERTAAGAADKRTQKEGEGGVQAGAGRPNAARAVRGEQPPVLHRTPDREDEGSPSPLPRSGRTRLFHPESLESLSSLPDPIDPTTITRTFRCGRKASAQASLATRDKTPTTKRKRSKGHARNAGDLTADCGPGPSGQGTDSVSSASEYQDRPLRTKQREQKRLLDRLTQEKLDSKVKVRHAHEPSSALAWSAPLHSSRNTCTEAADASSDFSLFEALRETIYAEVASLISQNESRPHFLIELFHELQLLNSDYLRQRALYSLQDVVTRHLTDRDTASGLPHPLGPLAWATASNSELTPSEPTSRATSDTDVCEKTARNNLNPVRRQSSRDGGGNESAHSTSSNQEPFANDDLGDTVIHLDRALARMRESQQGSGEDTAPGVHEGAGDGSTCFGYASGDAQCPQVDTEQLDRQIKAIMTEVIPFLKEHMEEVCSPQLLGSVRSMVLSLLQRANESREFLRFLHRQLGRILKENLSRMMGRMLKECGEDLLVMISEILFNELAFFSLMQERAARKPETPALKHAHSEERKTVDGEESVSAVFSDEDKDKDEAKETAAQHHGDRDAGLLRAERRALSSCSSEQAEERQQEEEEELKAETGGIPASLQAWGSAPLTPEQPSLQGPVRASGNGRCDLDHAGGCDVTEVRVAQSEPVEVETPTLKVRRSLDLGDADGQAPQGEGDKEPAEKGSSPEGSEACSPDTDSPVIVNEDEVGSGNLSQKSDEDDFVKVEGVPLQLSTLCEAELRKRITEEQQNNNLSAEIISGNVDGLTGLVGNSQMLKEPETIGAQSA
ncbi:pericentriolar material 1 protein isoform X1 [Conger conger]|uniref:pericentriolar material 1 protein isoform X1 n=1 Tax=Conger conger TaxID=82655 RepID=UPI002A59E998|nr:pericentriolar material 1 protein isoform X1 [Conger conger]XP_061100860.1 pericentriolar material 1 protein isoform X1 [Conger conger]